MKKIILAIALLCSTSYGVEREGGGGNTINGRPIEAYIGDITKYASYKKTIVPILKKIDSQIPGFADDLKRALKKTWYFVPVKLNTLPASVTGLQFASDQTVIQLNRSVWVSRFEFDAFTPADQALLVLHELVMGVFMSRTSAALTFEQHDYVRAITAFIMKNQNVSISELQEVLVDNGYLNYPARLDIYGAGKDPLKEFFNIIKKAELNKTFPTVHSYSTNGDRVTCINDFSVDESTGQMSVSTHYRTKTSGVETDDEPTKLIIDQNPEFGWAASGLYNSEQITYQAIEGKSAGTLGELRKAIYATFTGSEHSFSQYGIWWARCKSVSSTGECKWETLSEVEVTQQNLVVRGCAFNL